MLGRRKNREEAPQARPDSAAVGVAVNEVLKAFLLEPSPDRGPARDDGFVYNIAPVTGAEGPATTPVGMPNTEVPVPGVGMVSQMKVAQVMSRLEQLATRVGLDPQMSTMLSPDQARAVLQKVEALRVAGEITEPQQTAVAALVQTVSAQPSA